TRNVIDVPAGFVRTFAKPPHTAEGVENFLKQVVSWREQGNLYSEQTRFSDPWVTQEGKNTSVPTSLLTLADWQQFWGLEKSGSLQGRIRYAGGDLNVKLIENLA